MAINKIRLLENIDVIFISGDLSDDGSLWTYQYIDKAFQSLGIPTYCCPGNHDNIEMMTKGYIPSFYQIEEHISLREWDFYFLNTAVVNFTRGFISDDKLKFIKESICNANKPIGFIFHHPPIEPGGWLNRKILDNRDDFNKIIFDCPMVKLVLFGHIHYHMKSYMHHITFASSSGIGYAFDKELPKFHIANGKEGFNLIEISGQKISIENIIMW